MNSYITSNNTQYVVRHPVETDAAALLAYSKNIFLSTDQLLTAAHEFNMTVAGEKDWINSFNKNPNAFIRIAQGANQTITGLLFFAAEKRSKTRHTGEFGLTVHPDWQGLGIGRTLVQELLA